MIRMSDVEQTEVAFLWKPYIPFGKLTILHGDAGNGKTYLAMQLCAACTNKAGLPHMEVLEPFNVIYQTAEDGLGDTIKPRLIEAGADLEKVLVIDEGDDDPLTLADERIEKAIRQNDARLLIIDPIQAFLGPNVDMNRANEVRPILRKIGDVAQRTGCAIVLIGHLNKKENSKGLYRSLGSIDVVAAARSVLQVERDLEDTDIRIVTQIKNSLGPSEAVVRFEIRPQTGFSWLSVDTVPLSEKKEEPPTFETKMDKAAYHIKEVLSQGDVASIEMYKLLETEGISRRTAEVARKNMGIRCYRKMKQWYWSIRPQEE